MTVTISIVGGRPAMISAATGAVALAVAPVVRDHGLRYLIATVLITRNRSTSSSAQSRNPPSVLADGRASPTPFTLEQLRELLAVLDDTAADPGPADRVPGPGRRAGGDAAPTAAHGRGVRRPPQLTR